MSVHEHPLYRFLSRYLPLALSAVLFYGAFSRLTHGVYTPRWYAYQISKQPDDGSTVATMVPMMDISLGALCLVPQRRAKVVAAIMVVAMLLYGISLMVSHGEEWVRTASLCALSTLTVVASYIIGLKISGGSEGVASTMSVATAGVLAWSPIMEIVMQLC